MSFIVLSAVVYGVLFFSMGSAFLPGHAAWCTLLMWACALVGAFIAHQLYLPRVIGMMGAGMLLQNIPWSAVDAFPSAWGSQMRSAALATIFLRCGLELDLGTMRRYKFPSARLALLPGLAEALFDAGLAVALFEMDYLLGLTMGFILKAVGPGLVVPAMFRLQKALLGTDQGIPATVVISASFDDAVAITGYAIFSTLAIRPSGGAGAADTNTAWSIASGPSQVVFGIVGGVMLGYAVGATKLWNTRLKRGVAIYGACEPPAGCTAQPGWAAAHRVVVCRGRLCLWLAAGGRQQVPLGGCSMRDKYLTPRRPAADVLPGALALPRGWRAGRAVHRPGRLQRVGVGGAALCVPGALAALLP